MTAQANLDARDLLTPLLFAASKGDQSAFHTLYKQTAPRMYAIALRIVRRPEWAEEVMQEAYVKIWHNAADYISERGAVLTWMISILRYRAIDRLRKEKVHLSLDDENNPIEDPVADDDLLALIQQAEDKHLLHGCLHELQDDHRHSISAAFFEGLTHEQLSERLGKPLGTVKSWIRRGLLLLRRCLNNELQQPRAN